MERGKILNIQRYCLHDGPGIRTTVFLKGCPLTCDWCHNPESQSQTPEVRVIESRCARCGQCVQVCPERDSGPINEESPQCTRCGACVDQCPTGARQLLGQDMSVSQVMQVVLRDRLFYDNSRGGVTFSGGEPLLQPAFLRELLVAARQQCVHTALDTCGFADLTTLLELAPFVDLFLYDIKCMDDQKHLAHTGVSNRKILDNLQALSGIHDNIWVRVPLIPGFNDAAPLLKAAAKFVASLPAVRQVNLLPYHRLGTSKANDGQSEQALLGQKQITQEQLEEAAGLFQAAGLTTLIGG